MTFRFLLTSERLRLALASLFLVFGSVGLFISLTDSTRVQWTGHSAQGTRVGNVVYFSYDGATYRVKRTSRFLTDTVYFDPADPSGTAMLGDGYERALEISYVVIPYAIAATIVWFAVRRARRRLRVHQASGGKTFGQGLDEAFMRRQLESLRNPRSRPRDPTTKD